MNNVYGDLFEQIGFDAICITTNGFIKKNGDAVMGKGCAARAKREWPGIDKKLGENIILSGNVPSFLHKAKAYDVLSFPVKPRTIICNNDRSNVVTHMRTQFSPGSHVPGWAAIANIKIIENSAKNLVKFANQYEYKKIALPRPGCGAGELEWENVKPILSNILDNRFYSVTYLPKNKVPVW